MPTPSFLPLPFPPSTPPIQVAEANAISEELGKAVQFDLLVKSGASHDLNDREKQVGSASGRRRGLRWGAVVSPPSHSSQQVMVKVEDRSTRFVWLWSKAKFINRKYLMQELYQAWIDGLPVDIEKERVSAALGVE